jgi:hypothetical protein
MCPLSCPAGEFHCVFCIQFHVFPYPINHLLTQLPYLFVSFCCCCCCCCVCCLYFVYKRLRLLQRRQDAMHCRKVRQCRCNQYD